MRDAGSPGGGSDVFTYTLKDGDGDLSHTTLTIAIGKIEDSVTFAVAVGDEGAEPVGAAVSIGEEKLSDNAATFTVTMGGTALTAGNSASVVLDLDNGTATDSGLGADYSLALEAAIAAAIALLPAKLE